MKLKLILILFAFIGTKSYAQFGPQQIITTNASSAKTVFAADIDGDGAMDVLSASGGDDKIAWYRNTNGLGDFGTQNVIALLDFTRWVRAADLDGDGDMDVIASSGTLDLVVWYENLDGQGNFGPQQIISDTLDGAFSAIAADLNGDGDIDVISAADFSGIAWYENDGNGNFSTEIIITNTLSNNRSVFAGDIDSDGDLDIVINASGAENLLWFENLDGQGSFSSQMVVAPTSTYPNAVFCADIDGDDDLDVLTAINGANIVAWYENLDGNGNFGSEQIITTMAESAASVFATDLDNDGDIDVLSASVIDSKIAWYENTDGQGNFGPQQIISINAPGTLSTFAADLDNDGDMDVLSASQIDHKIAWYENLTILGVATHNKPTIKVYPNPSKEIVYIKAKQGVITKIELFDLLGKKIRPRVKGQNQINIAHLPVGSYLLKIYTENRIVIKRIVKE